MGAVGAVAGFACKVLVDKGLVSVVPAEVGVVAGLACEGVVGEACGFASGTRAGVVDGLACKGLVAGVCGLLSTFTSGALAGVNGVAGALVSKLGFTSVAAGSTLTSGLGSGIDSSTITQSKPYPFVGGVNV